MSAFEELLEEQLQNPEFKKEYEALEAEFTALNNSIINDDTNLKCKIL